MSVEIHPERGSCSYLWHPSNCLLWHDFLLKLGTEKSVTAHLPSEQRKTDAIWGGVSESFHSLAPRHLQRACMCKWSLTFHLQTWSSVLIIACGETFFPQRLWFLHVVVTSKTCLLLCFFSEESSWENPAYRDIQEQQVAMASSSQDETNLSPR